MEPSPEYPAGPDPWKEHPDLYLDAAEDAAWEWLENQAPKTNNEETATEEQRP